MSASQQSKRSRQLLPQAARKRWPTPSRSVPAARRQLWLSLTTHKAPDNNPDQGSGVGLGPDLSSFASAVAGCGDAARVSHAPWWSNGCPAARGDSTAAGDACDPIKARAKGESHEFKSVYR